MTARIVSLLVWAAVLAAALAWGLPLVTRPTPVPAGASLAQPLPPAGASLARLLGQPPAAPTEQAVLVPADSRFKLLGVVAPRSGTARGLALISVDGKPARALAVGREIEPGLRVLQVGHREVLLGAAAGAPSVTLSLPPLAEAQRGRPGDPTVAAGAALGMPGLPAPGGAGGGMVGALRPPVVGAQPLPPVPLPPGAGNAQQLQQLQMFQQQQLLQQQMQRQQMQAGMHDGQAAGQNDGQNDGQPGSLPYQPDGNGNLVPSQPAPPPATAPRFR